MPGATEAVDEGGVEAVEGFARAGRNDLEIVGDEDEAAFAFFVQKVEIRDFTFGTYTAFHGLCDWFCLNIGC